MEDSFYIYLKNYTEWRAVINSLFRFVMTEYVNLNSSGVEYY